MITKFKINIVKKPIYIIIVNNEEENVQKWTELEILSSSPFWNNEVYNIEIASSLRNDEDFV